MKLRCVYNIGIIALLIIALYPCALAAQDGMPDTLLHRQDTAIVSAPVGVPVVIEHDTLFTIYGSLGPFTPAMRAVSIRERVQAIIDNEALHPDSLVVRAQHGSTVIAIDSLVVMAITDYDAAAQESTVGDIAQNYVQTLRTAIAQTRASHNTETLLLNGGIALGIIAVAVLLFWLMSKVFPTLYTHADTLGTKFPALRFRSYTLMSGGSLSMFLILLLKGIRLSASLLLIYYGITTILNLFPYTKYWNISPILKGLLLAGLLTVVVSVLYRGLRKLARLLHHKLHAQRDTIVKPVQFKNMELLPRTRIAEMLQFGVKIARTFLDIILLYFYITILFSLFSFTQTWAATLFAYITTPLYSVFTSFVNFLPNIFVILVTIAVAFYLIKLTKWAFQQIENGSLEFPHFYAEWARPTYGIVRVLIIVFVVIIVFPYLPGSGSPAFQNVSLFLGLLLSISSASAVANGIAGVVLTYMRPFKIGDRVKIADTVGDVVEKSILVTRVRTIKNVEITIPNAMVLSSHLINFSTSAQERGLILHTKITIGYDVPWRTVHELLISAAQATAGINAEPKPFVLQTALNDFYVEYEINAYTNQPNTMAKIYSELHSNIQDKFNEGGVEILSPHYSAMRDGNQITIPQDYLPNSYEAPSFRLFGVNFFGGGKRSSGGEE